jgi:hypothetical protein
MRAVVSPFLELEPHRFVLAYLGNMLTLEDSESTYTLENFTTADTPQTHHQW